MTARKEAPVDEAPTETPADVPTQELTVELAVDADEQQKLVQEDPYDVLDGKSVQEATASSIGGSDQYPYLDKSKVPLNERDQPVDSNDGPSQADLNPAFSAKADKDS